MHDKQKDQVNSHSWSEKNVWLRGVENSLWLSIYQHHHHPQKPFHKIHRPHKKIIAIHQKNPKKNVQKKSTQNTHTPNHWGYDITRNSFGEASQTYLIQQAHDSLPVAIHGTIEAHDIGLNVAVLGRFRSDQRPEVPPGWRFFPSQKQTPPKLTRVLDTERIFQHRYINHFARSMVPQYSCADSVSLTQGPPATL